MMEKEKETKKNEGEESVDQTINLVRSKWFGENLQMPKKSQQKYQFPKGPTQMYINFNQTIKNVIYQLQKIEYSVNREDNEELFAFFLYLLKVRHDFLHFLVLQSLGQDWQEERKLSDYFPMLPEDYGKKTPDICLQKKDIWYIIDVSISTDCAKASEIKTKKYLPIIDYININGNNKKNCFCAY